MRRSELLYDLPPELIAQHPVEPRDASRLLILHRREGRIEHRTFRDLPACLRPGDCLVLNDTRVLPARFFCRRSSGGRVEALFLHETGGAWRLLLKPAARLRSGEILAVEGAAQGLRLGERGERGHWLATPDPPVDPARLLLAVGQTPLPPYIRRAGQPEQADAQRYQTVYAARPGAVAAPTAGLHFTPELLEQAARRGVVRATLTLHVGAGTFEPVEVEDLSEHRMHAEWYELPAPTVRLADAARRCGGRIVAVGTTSARVLESCPLRLGHDAPQLPGRAEALRGWTDLFIYPPYSFRNVDALLTNFHLPGSTLLALVMALGGIEAVRAAYREAIERGYRFYSYGDAMLIC